MRGKKIMSFVFVAVFLSCFSVRGQSFERSVIGSAGGTYFDGVNLEVDYTLGEFAILTLSNVDNYLTQGFMQPYVDSGVNIIETMDNGITISIYPNPTNSSLTMNILSDIDQEFTIGLYDLLGQCLTQQKVVSKFDGILNLEIDMRTCSPGNYYLRIINGNNYMENIKVLKINN
jgi:hypothetical protein